MFIKNITKTVIIFFPLLLLINVVACAQGFPSYLEMLDQSYTEGDIPIPPAEGSTAIVQKIVLSDSGDAGDQDVHIIQIDVDCLGTADGNDIESVRILRGTSHQTEVGSASVSSFPATICSGADLFVIPDDGEDILWVEVTLSGNAIHGRVLQLQTWIRYWEDREDNPRWGFATDGAPEVLKDVTLPTVTTVTPTTLDDSDVGLVSVSITFSEAMDTTTNPRPTITGLATDPYTITGSSWSDGDTKWIGSFTLNDDNEEAPGTYHVSGFKDAAGNEMLPDTSHTVDVDTTQASPDTAAVFRVTSEGNVYADGAYYGEGFHTGGADIAEWVPVSEPVAPGDVLELDPDHPGYYRKARERCSTLVAGVVSTDPGFILGAETPSPSASGFGLWTMDHGLWTESSALLALIGIVPVKVTDEGGPIQPGDLLVVSSTLGYAMRWDADQESPCGFVGKALEPLTDPSGIILLLLMAH